MIPEALVALYLQAQPQQIQMPTVTEGILALVGVGSTLLNWRLATTALSLELKMKTETDKLKAEISAKIDALSEKFVPGSVDVERRQSVQVRLERAEGEINKNRDRIHEMANTIQQLMLGPVENIHNSLRDKARKITVLEEQGRSLADDVHEITERLNDIDRNRK